MLTFIQNIFTSTQPNDAKLLKSYDNEEIILSSSYESDVSKK